MVAFDADVSTMSAFGRTAPVASTTTPVTTCPGARCSADTAIAAATTQARERSALRLERFVMRVGVGRADHTAMEDRASAARRCAAMCGLAFVVRLGYLAWARPAFSGVYWAIATDLLHH